MSARGRQLSTCHLLEHLQAVVVRVLELAIHAEPCTWEQHWPIRADGCEVDGKEGSSILQSLLRLGTQGGEAYDAMLVDHDRTKARELLRSAEGCCASSGSDGPRLMAHAAVGP